MQRPAQAVIGSLQPIGPQPVLNTALGTSSDAAATNPTAGTVSAKLGALMIQNAQIIDLLEQMLNLMLEARNGHE